MIYYFILAFISYSSYILIKNCIQNNNYIWKLMKIYTYCQLKFFKIYKYIKFNKSSVIKIIDNGKEIYKIKLNDFNKEKYNLNLKDYNMIIYENHILHIDKYDLIIFNTIHNVKTEYIKSNIKLCNPCLKINDNISYEIEINNCNYYIVNNILFDKYFIKWWLYNYKNYILKENDKYNVVFFDNDMNYKNITEKEYLIIYKDNYKIFNL